MATCTPLYLNYTSHKFPLLLLLFFFYFISAGLENALLLLISTEVIRGSCESQFLSIENVAMMMCVRVFYSSKFDFHWKRALRKLRPIFVECLCMFVLVDFPPIWTCVTFDRHFWLAAFNFVELSCIFICAIHNATYFSLLLYNCDWKKTE